MSHMEIDGRLIGPGNRPYLIAEMSANHGGDVQRGREIIRLAKAAGADAVKMQAYTADDLTIDSDAPDFQLDSGLWAGQTLYQLYEKASTPFEFLGPLFEEAGRLGLTAFATPFSEAAIDHLSSIGAPAYKIASFEAVDLELVRAAAKTGKPLIISTGLCDAEEIARAIETALSAGASGVSILKCTSAYPASPDIQNLLTIPDMIEKFAVPVGFSDHTLGNGAAVGAVALGASLVEKHFINAKEPATADSKFSCLPGQFEALRRDIDDAWQSRGEIAYGYTEAEEKSLAYRRSLYAIAPIRKGDAFSRENVRSIRPGFGVSPRHLDALLGKPAARDFQRGEPITDDALGGAGA